MRVVAGELRGRTIQTPAGHDTRPTSDRARQAIFNILEHAAFAPDLDGARVLDLFAGSGAMGIEALSRGAASCVFVEQAQAAAAAVSANLAALGLSARARLVRADATQLSPPTGDAAAEVVFLDPPYGKGLGEAALARAAETGWLKPGALAVLEKGAREPILQVHGFEVVDERTYGAAKVVFLRRQG